MSAKVCYIHDDISKNISIDFENREDLIDCFLNKARENAFMENVRICLIGSVTEELLDRFSIKVIGLWSKNLNLAIIPIAQLNSFSEFSRVTTIEFHPSC
jgi:hypothetical protein